MKIKLIIPLVLATSLILASCNISNTPPPDQSQVATSAAMTVQAVLTPLASPTASGANSTEGNPDQGPIAQPGNVVAPGVLCDDIFQIVSWKRDGVDYAFDEVDKKLAPNQAFVMEWELENKGTCTWDNSYSLQYRNGEHLAFADSLPIIPLGNTVTPGESFKVSIQMAAPGESGHYESTYSITNGLGEFVTNFGVITNVGNDSASSGPLAKPGELKYQYDCSSGSVVINLSWLDRSDNEDGFRVYREGDKLADLSANTTTYQDIAPSTGQWNYTVSAFNNSGESPASVVVDTKNCQ